MRIFERQSNIELLRILAMFAIVIGHFVSQTHCINELSGIVLYITLMLSSGLRIAVGIFLMIGCWFLVDSEFKSTRVLNLYLNMLFYTLSIFIILKAICYPVSLWNSLKAIFPFFLFGTWFVSAYIWLILFSPFLKKMLNFGRDFLKKILILLFLAIPVLSLVYIKMDTKLCVFMSFMYCYLNIGYFKKYLNETLNINKNLLLLCGLCLYLFLITIKYYYIGNGLNGLPLKVINSYLMDYHCLPNLFIAFSIFYYFLNTKFKTNKIINYVSSVTLTVYIIHQAPGFINYLWHNIYKCKIWISSNYFLIYLILVPISLYIVSIILELFRKKLVMPILMRSKLYKYLCKILDNFYQNVC